jgi:hypothetical protein
MAGSTANTALLYPSNGFPLVEINGFGYIGGQVMPFVDIVGPTESNRSNKYISDIMADPREPPSLDDFLDPRFFVKMPYSNKIQIEVKINSITQGKLRAPDFEGP